jgi:hypothetical protein
MKQGLRKIAIVVLSGALVLAVAILVGCGGSATPTPAGLAEAYVSSNLPTNYQDALPASTQLILGTFQLEGTPNAVTAEQAKTLLPLWRSLQSGAVQDSAEANAVLGQIERAMTSDQLKAIAAMQLTQTDLASWEQEHGMNFVQRPGGPNGTPGALPEGTPGEFPRGTPGAGGSGNFDPAARETMRAGFDSMPEDQRAQLMATMQAGGNPAGGFGARAGQSSVGQIRFMLPPLIELLTQRAGSP